MISNYFKIALRNIRKHKAYSFINILGLTVGLTCAVLIILYVQDELSYDTFNTKADRIYRVTREWLNADGSTSLHLARVAPPIGTLLEHEYPSTIENMVRLLDDGTTSFTVGQKRFVENRIYWAEGSFFNVFTFRMIEGDPETALSQPMSVVLTQSTARKYFGDQPALGKTILYDGKDAMKVTGVMQDVPQNSHFHFDMLLSFVTLKNFPGADDLDRDWGSNNYATYLLLSPHASAKQLQASFPQFLDKYYGRSLKENGVDLQGRLPHEINVLHLQNIKDIHLHSHLTTELDVNGDIVDVWLFSAIGGFVLLIACINFMNLATARSAQRAREIGMRKILGAYRKQVMTQFLGEAVLTSVFALALAFPLAQLTLPTLNDFIGKNLSLSAFLHPQMMGEVLLLVIVVGLLAGSYPALVLSSFRPLQVFGSGVGNSRKSRFRRIMVVGQFGISITLIVCLAVVYQQLNHLRTRNLGFNKEQLVVLPCHQPIRENLQTVKSRLLEDPNITNVSASRLVPSNMLLNSWGAQVIDGTQPRRLKFRLAVQEIDYDFFSTYQIPLVAGRFLSRKYATDDTSGFILNETAVKALGWTPEEAIGKGMIYGGRTGKVVGVVRDFNFETLKNKIVPIIFLINPRGFRRVTVRLAGTDNPGSLALLEKVWKEYEPDFDVNYGFLDDRYDALYRSEQRLGTLVSVFASLAVFVACLGLFGLASFMAERRTKEIGIRKVLGAKTGGIVFLFSKEFLTLVLISNAIAWPVSYYAMSRWLSDFAYRIGMQWWVFVLAGGLALLIALFTVSFQAVRAALANPADALRYE
jgi:putative ABC transport system permease protein